MTTPTDKIHTLVIGGTRGSGRALVQTMAREGHTVSVIGRRAPSKADSDSKIARYWIVDLLDQESLLAAWTEIIGQEHPINNLVFFQRYRGSGNNWEGEIETSLTATKTIIDLWAEQCTVLIQNSIVVVSSLASDFVADEQPLSYHVAKAGLNQLVRYYAVALGSKGIRVNAVSPGIVMKEEAEDFYSQNERLHNVYKQITPLGRMGTPQEIANVIAFLCSSKASLITGQNIIVDGGVSLLWQETLARKMVSLDNLNVTRQPN